MQRKPKLKRSCAAILSAVIAISVLFPITGIVAVATTFPAPVFDTEAELLKEFPTPDVTIPTTGFSESYAPQFSGSVGDGAPVIGTITEQAAANDSLSISGINFLGANVYLYGLVGGVGTVRQLKQTSNSADYINAIIDYDFDYSMYMVWIEGADGKMSAPVRVNAPKLTWLSAPKIACGNELRVYGKFLTENNADTNAVSNVYFTNGTNYYQATVTEATPYRVTVTVPASLADGNYKVWVHNGHGGSYGWSNGLSIEVQAGVDNIWTGNTITVQRNQNGETNQTAITAAISAASNYGTIYLPAGDYYIRQKISYNSKKLRFVGETDTNGNNLVNFIYVATQSGGTDSLVAGTYGFEVWMFPSEFNNITFTDNVDPNVLATPSQFNINYSNISYLYANKVQQASTGFDKYFRVDGCKFITRRCCSNTTNAHPEYSYYSTRCTENEPLCIAVNYASITNCYIEANVGLVTRGARYSYVNNNTLVGTWVQDGNSGRGAIADFSSSYLDISENTVRGKDYFTDPDGVLSACDQTFGRGIVIQTPYNGAESIYIMDNDMERIGEAGANSGEHILFEDLSKTYVGTVSDISTDTKTLTLSSISSNKWKQNASQGNEYYFYGYATTDADVAVQYSNPRRIITQKVIIVRGKGAGQYRTITGADATSVTVDRPWDVAPDENSVIAIAPSCDNSVIFRNRIVGPEEFYTNYNATAGIQAYATMLGTVADRNDFNSMHDGFMFDAHYNEKTYANVYARNSDNTISTTVIDTNCGVDSGYNFFANTLLINNKISNVRYGVHAFPVINNGQIRNYSNEEAPAILIQGTMIRNNDISDCRYAYQESTANLGGGLTEKYNSLEKAGAIGICIGKDFGKPKYAYAPTFDTKSWLKNVVAENNSIEDVASCYIELAYGQENTILRNNNCDAKGKLSEFLVYEDTINEDFPVKQAVYYSDYGSSAYGMYGSADNVESFSVMQNGNFDEGLKYFADATATTTAADRASIVTEGTNNYLEITSDDGIKSVGFSAAGVNAGKKVALVYDSKGAEDHTVSLAGDFIFSPSDSKRTLTNTNVATGWTRKITSYVIISAVADISRVDLNCIIKGNGTTASYIDNIELVKVYEDKGIYETLDGTQYYLSDGQAVGGTQADGMSQAAGAIYDYSPTEYIANADFNEGFKYWTNVDGISEATTAAAITDATTVSVSIDEQGIMSAPFKINAEDLSDADVENKVAFIIKTGGNTAITAELYEDATKLTDVPTIEVGNGLVIVCFGAASWNQNSVYNVAIKSTPSATVSQAIDYVGVARYNTTAQFTDLGTHKVYSTAGELTSGDINTNEFFNRDFSDGLNYWTATGTVTVLDGIATVASGATFKSAYFKAALSSGDNVAVMYRYKTAGTTANITVNRKVVSGSGDTISTPLTFTATASADYIVKVSQTFAYTETVDTENYFSVTLGGTADYDFIRIVKKEANGNYTDVLTGEQWYSNLEEMGGTQANGIKKDRASYTNSIYTPTSTFMNGDFSQGLKYWSASINNTTEYPSACASVQNGEVTLEFHRLYQAICTTPFYMPNSAAGKKFRLEFDARIVTYGSGRFNCRIFEGTSSKSDTQWGTVSDDWVSFKTNALTMTDANLKYVIDFQTFDSTGTQVVKMRNLRIVYLEDGDATKRVNPDGSPVDAIYGDANCDGVVDLLDYQLVSDYISNPTGVVIYKAAANLDKSQDMQITTADLPYYEQYLSTGIKNF